MRSFYTLAFSWHSRLHQRLNIQYNDHRMVLTMSNTNDQVNTENRNTATLGGILTMIESIYQIADEILDKQATDYQLEEALGFISEKATLALMDIEELKQQIIGLVDLGE